MSLRKEQNEIDVSCNLNRRQKTKCFQCEISLGNDDDIKENNRKNPITTTNQNNTMKLYK